MQLNRVTLPRIAQLREQLVPGLRSYRSAYMRDANDGIKSALGLRPGDSLHSEWRMAREMWVDVQRGNYSLSSAGKARLEQRLCETNESNIHSSLHFYTPLYVTLKLFSHLLAGKRILQLAPNYGPFLHFLKHVEGAEVYGADVAMASCTYAFANGISVVPASATHLPFKKNTFDFVLSCHFLSWDYFHAKGGDFFNNLLRRLLTPEGEVMRVLKPGAHFISCFENLDEQGAPRLKIQRYSAEAQAAYHGYEEIGVIKKWESGA